MAEKGGSKGEIIRICKNEEIEKRRKLGLLDFSPLI